MSRLTYKDDNDYKLLRGRECQWKKKIKEEYETIDNSIQKLGKLEDIEEKLGFSLEVLYWLWQDEPIFVLNLIDKSLQEIEHPLNYYIPIKQAFDIRNELFETTHEKRIWNTGGVIIYLKDYKKTWFLKEDRSE